MTAGPLREEEAMPGIPASGLESPRPPFREQPAASKSKSSALAYRNTLAGADASWATAQ